MSDAAIIRALQQVQEQALKLKTKGLFEAAREQITQFLASCPPPVSAEGRRAIGEFRVTAADVAEKCGHVVEAVSHLEEALELDPKNRRAALRIVEVTSAAPHADGPPDVARLIEYLRSGAQQSVKKICIKRLHHLLHVRLDAEATEVAWRVPLLESVVDAFPNLKFARTSLGRAHYVRNDFRLAIPYLREAHAAEPKSTSIANMLGRAYEKSGLAEQAQAVYESSLAVDGNQPGIRFRLGRILLYMAQTAAD